MEHVLPNEVSEAWEHREGPVVFTTVDSDGIPNAIYAGAVGKHDDGTIVIANNYFDKTIRNIRAGSDASVLFITDAGKAYQIKGSISYHQDGPYFEFMKSWNSAKHPGHGAAAVAAREVYSGAERLL
ncbi:MAG: pyridoxamine 5'-phosphate oxidase family protein [Spirochaetota bacterium]